MSSMSNASLVRPTPTLESDLAARLKIQMVHADIGHFKTLCRLTGRGPRTLRRLGRHTSYGVLEDCAAALGCEVADLVPERRHERRQP